VILRFDLEELYERILLEKVERKSSSMEQDWKIYFTAKQSNCMSKTTGRLKFIVAFRELIITPAEFASFIAEKEQFKVPKGRDQLCPPQHRLKSF
jgi:hypothetical protein